MMMGISVFELMDAYNISYQVAQMLQFKILMIMLLVAVILYTVSLAIERYCPKLYRKLEKWNIV